MFSTRWLRGLCRWVGKVGRLVSVRFDVEVRCFGELFGCLVVLLTGRRVYVLVVNSWVLASLTGLLKLFNNNACLFQLEYL